MAAVRDDGWIDDDEYRIGWRDVFSEGWVNVWMD